MTQFTGYRMGWHCQRCGKRGRAGTEVGDYDEMMAHLRAEHSLPQQLEELHREYARRVAELNKEIDAAAELLKVKP